MIHRITKYKFAIFGTVLSPFISQFIYLSQCSQGGNISVYNFYNLSLIVLYISIIFFHQSYTVKTVTFLSATFKLTNRHLSLVTEFLS